MLERWHKSSRRLLSFLPIANRHRERHLKSATLKTWMAKLKERDLDRLEQQLTGRKEIKRIRKAFAHWKGKWYDKRTERWKKDMAEKELDLIERRRKNQISAVFQVRHSTFIYSFADKHLALARRSTFPIHKKI